MKKKLAAIFSVVGWFAIIAQYILMIENRQASILETSIRFISFFTILTNALAAIYFTCVVFDKNHQIKIIDKPGTLSAITVYITLVALVYQFVLRQSWHPTGLQMIVDELLHSVIPVLVIVFWFLYEIIKPVKYSQILQWAIYPLVYLICILIRGSFSNYYPYPFINVTTIGMSKALTNSGILIVIFLIISALFLVIGKAIIKRV
ncbi:MAG: Pr6Pr family membrane protein [Ginsengibacter sp.]